MLEETNNEKATETLHVRGSTKQLLDSYKVKHMRKGSLHSYDETVRFLFYHIDELKKKKVDMPQRYKLAHRWIKSGDTLSFIEQLERMARAYLDDPVNEFPNRPEVVESVRQNLEYLKKHSDVL